MYRKRVYQWLSYGFITLIAVELSMAMANLRYSIAWDSGTRFVELSVWNGCFSLTIPFRGPISNHAIMIFPHTFGVSHWDWLPMEDTGFNSRGILIKVPFWLLILWTSGLLCSVRLLDNRAVKGLCRKCYYDLRENVSGICPECGTPMEYGGQCLP